MPNNRGTDCCSQILFNRGLKEASTWLLTLFNKQVFGFIETPLNSIQKVKFNLSLSQFYSNHFLLAAETASNSDHPILIFIHFYSIYNHLKRSIAHDSLSLDFPINDITPPDQSLFSDLYSQIMHLNSSDPFMLYLSALLKLNLAQPNLAIPLAISSIIAFPQNWSCWLLLSHCLETVENRNIYIDQIPDSVFKDAMIIQLGIDVPNEKSIIESKISNLELMFPDNFIVSSWRAIHCYNNREFNEAVCLFRDIFKKHPYSLDNLDLYSNVLYVLKLNEDLYSLAKDCMKLNKYTVSTCIVLANYYSSIKDYQKAIQFLHRALKLDPEYSQAWTLMGHEYIEQKNPNAAVTAYNRALELKSTDYRAWYGLGQVYESLNQYTHAIYYYQQATTHRPDDSRMWVALAAVYVKNSDSGNGLKAYNRALKLMDDGDDNLGHVLYSLGDLYTDVDDERTVYFYSCAVAVDSNVNEKSRACLWLERYYHEQGDREKERIWRAELDGF